MSYPQPTDPSQVPILEPIRFFISYHREDNELGFPDAVTKAYEQIRVQLLANADRPVDGHMARRAITGFMDVRPECQSGGDDWRQLVDTRAAEANIFLPFVTQEFLHAPECQRELDLFRKTHDDSQGIVIPLLMMRENLFRKEAEKSPLASYLASKTYRKGDAYPRADLNAVWHAGGINTPLWNQTITFVVDDILQFCDIIQPSDRIEKPFTPTKLDAPVPPIRFHTGRLTTDDFIVRREEMAIIRRSWDTQPAPTGIALCGPAGSGKTQLALCLMHEAVADNKTDIIAWLDGSTSDTLRTDLTDLAISLGLMRADEHLHAAQASERVLNFLAETSQTWAIFIDNADESFDTLVDLNLLPLARDSHRTTIITTRRRSPIVGSQGRIIVEIGPFEDSEAVTYIKSRLPNQPDTVIEDLNNRLSRLPLDLDAATSYITAHGIPPKKYLAMVERGAAPTAPAASAAINEPMRPTRVLAQTLTASDGITTPQQLSCSALIAAVMNQSGAPASLWNTRAVMNFVYGETKENITQSDAKSIVGMAPCLQSLSRLSLVCLATQDDIQIVRMHPQVAETLRIQAGQARLADAINAVATGLFQMFADAPHDRASEELIASNVLHLASRNLAIKRLRRNLLEAAGESATRLIAVGSLNLAASMLNEIIRMTTTFNIDNLPQVFALKRVLAQTQGDGFQAMKAVELLSALLDQARSVMGNDALETIQIQTMLGRYLGESGHPTQAINLLKQAVRIQSNGSLTHNAEVLTTRSELVWWLGELKGPVEAIAGYRNILEVRRSLLGVKHPETLKTEHNLAFWLGRNSEFAESITLFQQNLEYRTAILGPHNIDTYFTRSNLAWTLGQAGLIGEAADAYRLLLPNVQMTLGESHPYVFRVQGNLGVMLFQAGRLDEATLFLRLAFNSRLQALGFDSPYTLRTAGWLVRCLAANGKENESVALAEKIREIEQASSTEPLRYQ